MINSARGNFDLGNLDCVDIFWKLKVFESLKIQFRRSRDFYTNGQTVVKSDMYPFLLQIFSKTDEI